MNSCQQITQRCHMSHKMYTVHAGSTRRAEGKIECCHIGGHCHHLQNAIAPQYTAAGTLLVQPDTRRYKKLAVAAHATVLPQHCCCLSACQHCQTSENVGSLQTQVLLVCCGLVTLPRRRKPFCSMTKLLGSQRVLQVWIDRWGHDAMLAP